MSTPIPQPLPFEMWSSSDHASPWIGTPRVWLRKSGQGTSWGLPVGAVTSAGDGSYWIAADPTDQDTPGPLYLYAESLDGTADPSLYVLWVGDPGWVQGVTTYPFPLPLYQIAALNQPLVGATGLTVQIGKRGGPMAAPSDDSSLVEAGHGFYDFFPAPADVDTAGYLAIFLSATDAAPAQEVFELSVPVVAPSSDLITADYAQLGLAAANLNAAQQAFVPYAISAASNEIRRWCMDRDFTQGTYTEIYPVALDGYIRLAQIPVNQILRVQAQPQTACSVSNGSSSVQYAQVLFSYTGDVATGQTVTGITLNWTSNGTPSTQTILFTTGMTINALSVLINAVGSGWNAEPDSILGAWPVTQITTGYIGEGATTQSSPGTAALKVFSQDITNARFHPDDGQRTGLVWVGSRYPGLGPSWGLDWAWWDNANDQGSGIVQVTYNAGFASIPDIVQLACVEGVKVILQRMKINPYLESETAGEYAYKLASNMMQALPSYVIQELSSYRITNA